MTKSLLSFEIQKDCPILWYKDWYDGYLEGACTYNGEFHVFSFKKEYFGKFTRREPCRTFYVYKPTPEQEKWEKYWHNEFETHNTSPFNTEYMMEIYYNPKKAWDVANPDMLKYAKKQCVGWTTYSVLDGNPWVEWRQSRIRYVGGQEKNET